MAEKSFGVKEVNLIGASGTPTITSPNNLNLNAVNVAISTNVSVGGTLTVSGNVSVGGTLTYEDVTNIDSVGVVTARDGVVVVGRGVSIAAGGLNVTAGVSTFAGITTVTGNTLFAKQVNVSGVSTFQTASAYTFTVGAGNLTVNNTIYGTSKIMFLGGSGGDMAYYAGGTSYSDHIFRTLQGGSQIERFRIGASGDIGLSGENYGTSGQVLTSGGSGSAATWAGIAVTEAPVVDYTITGSNPNYYFHGGGVDETDGNPDLYLIRGQKYRFNNTTGTGHPFRFTHTGNANAAYSNGVTGTESGVQFWTIPYDAPAKLFYVCTIHNGMVGNIYIRGANGQNDNVGITTFTSRLEVKGGGGGTLKVTGSAAHTSKIVIADNSGTANGNCLVEGGDGSDFFTIQSSGNVLFENGKGINFGATEGSGATTSVLDDYEEGVFTPTLSGGTSDVNMHYTKIGRVVHITGSLAFSSVSGSGTMTMGGLPYTSINTLDSYTHLAAHAYDSLNVGNTTYQFQTLRVNQNSTNMVIVIPAGNGNVRTFGQYSHLSGSTFRFRVAGYYITA